jgi:hypothetical protein
MTTANYTDDDIGSAIRADDALKYAAAILRARTDWTLDSIGGAMCDGDHDVELDAIAEVVKEIEGLAALFRYPRLYSDGRRATSLAEIEPGLVTEHVWYPDPNFEKPASHRGHLLSGDPNVPSPGIYEVTTNPTTQHIHIRVVRLERGS